MTTTPSPDLRAALLEFLDERMDEPHAMTPAEERLMEAARAALAVPGGWAALSRGDRRADEAGGKE